MNILCFCRVIYLWAFDYQLDHQMNNMGESCNCYFVRLLYYRETHLIQSEFIMSIRFLPMASWFYYPGISLLWGHCDARNVLSILILLSFLNLIFVCMMMCMLNFLLPWICLCDLTCQIAWHKSCLSTILGGHVVQCLVLVSVCLLCIASFVPIF